MDQIIVRVMCDRLIVRDQRPGNGREVDRRMDTLFVLVRFLSGPFLVPILNRLHEFDRDLGIG